MGRHRLLDAMHVLTTANPPETRSVPPEEARLAWLLLGAALPLVFVLILRARGMDVNHRPIAVLRAHRPSVFCLPRYHALHHAFPTAHFSSWVKLLDCVLGTGTALEGRRVAATPGDLARARRAIGDVGAKRNAREEQPAPRFVERRLQVFRRKAERVSERL